MQNVGTIWVVVSASEAQSRLVDLIDKGYLAEAIGFSNTLNAMTNKMKKFIQQFGGSMPIALYERLIMQIPSSAADQIPSIMKSYSEALNGKIAVGMGLTMEEAARAAEKSTFSGQIELYDPEEISNDIEFYEKSGQKSRRFSYGVVLPPNLFDPTTPDEAQYKTSTEDDIAPIPTPEQQMQAEAQLIQAVAEQLGAGEAQKQMEQQQEAQQAGGRDLLESLNGGPVDGHEPQEEQPQEQPKQAQSSSEKQGDGDEQQLEAQVEEAEEVTTDDKLAMTLDKVKNQIPQIMGLAESNPKAFKDTMNMINKLIQLAHTRSKNTKKSEYRLQIENLIKAINLKAAYGKPKTNGIIYPPGTRLGRYKKVLVDGKQKWREMSSGAIQDDKGKAISVKEFNKEKNKDQSQEDIQDV